MRAQRSKAKRAGKPKRATAPSQKKKAVKTEVTALGKALRALGSAGGGILGSTIGLPGAGSAVGGGLGATISRFLGQGDYEVDDNSIVKAHVAPKIPMMHSAKQSVIIRHKEYLGKVSSSQAFNVKPAYVINPGVQATFPWLSRIAQCYQEWTALGIVFEYVPTSGSISSTQALGSVMLQTSYRSNDNPPSSKVEMLNEYWACESVPFQSFCHPLECDPKENPFNVQYVRTTNVPAGDNQLLYDLGTTYVATEGQSADGVTLGDLWITYEVELRKPVLASNVTGPSFFVSGRWSISGGTLVATNIYPTGTSAYVSTGLLPVTASGMTVTIPAGEVGNYWICTMVGSNAGITNASWPGTVSVVNCVNTPFYTTLSDGAASIQTTSTFTRTVIFETFVTKTDPGLVATVTLPSPTLTAGQLDYTVITVVKARL